MFDTDALCNAVATHVRVARIVIASHDGSSPRETGAAMLVWADGQSGTIGGGALEWQAVSRAKAMLAAAGGGGGTSLDRQALGPALGQCCGGAVTLLTEIYHAANLPAPEAEIVARSLDGQEMPLTVRRLLDRARSQGRPPLAQLVQGWMVEPVARPVRQLWIWGAGHVGRAVVQVIAPLPGVSLTWIDIASERFPVELPANVRSIAVPDPVNAVVLAPKEAGHLILTFSHALDLDLCHRLLCHGFTTCGLIGSATKWSRFRNRLSALGHGPAAIATIRCPIGDPALGKDPQAIAIGVAAAFMQQSPQVLRQESRG